MNIEEFTKQINDIDKMKYMMTFEELVDKIKDACNNYALKTHNQSTFIMDKEHDFLAEVFSKNENIFISVNERHSKYIIAFYSIN